MPINDEIIKKAFSNKKIETNFEGNFEKIKHHELRVSTKGLKAIRITLFILVALMLTVALTVTIVHYTYDQRLTDIANI
jgi:hypothetical protein